MVGRGLQNALPHGDLFDRAIWSLKFRHAHGRQPDPTRRLFNDYLYGLKTSGALLDPMRQYTSDKIYVKDFVSGIIGPDYVPRTIAVFNTPDSVSKYAVDGPFIMKPAHASGVYIVKDRDDGNARATFAHDAFQTDAYSTYREPNYRHLRKRVICEELLDGDENINDYKIFCFDGEPRLIQVDINRRSAHKRALYTADWQKLPIIYNKPLANDVPRPSALTGALEVAGVISKKFESVRVDLYLIGHEIFVGELTHCPEQAHGKFGSLEHEMAFSKIYFGD